MVSLARNLRGLTQSQLAELLGVQQGTISKLEGGLISATREMCAGLSRVLKLPKHFFTQTDRVYGLGTHAYMHRRRQRISAEVRRRIEAKLNLIRIHTERLLESVNVESPYLIPQISPTDQDLSPEEVAMVLRAQWLVADGPIDNVTILLEGAGIFVIPCDFGTTSMDATSIWLPGSHPLIFINESIPGDRWRFTLCHELGHLVMHNEPSEYMESEASQFASAMLMPKSDIIADFGKITLSHLANLKSFWKVSIQSLIERAYSLQKITKNQRRYFYMDMARHGYRTKEPVLLEPEEPYLHGMLFDAHKNNLDYSLDDFASLFSMYDDEIREYYFREPRRPILRAVK